MNDSKNVAKMERKRPHLDPLITPDDSLTSAVTHNDLMDMTTNHKLLAKQSDEEKMSNNNRVHHDSRNEAKKESKPPHLESLKTTDDSWTSAKTHNNLMQSNIKEANN